MPISFECDSCGLPIEVPDALAGRHGHCKHCGRQLTVPGRTPTEAAASGSDPPLRLREVGGDEPERLPPGLLDAPPPLAVRPAAEAPRPRPEAISDPDEILPPRTRRRPRPGAGEYVVADPYRVAGRGGRAGPPPRWVNLPSLTARALAFRLRTLRDWLYLASIAGLVLVLYGYLFSARPVLHLGATVVVLANGGMLAVGLAYLVSLPFKESLWHGLANLLIPFYAVYYWATRWQRLRRPVRNTLGAFVPILLVGLAYLAYEEAPAVEEEIRRELPALERELPALDRELEELDRALGLPADEATGPDGEEATRP